MSDQTTSNPLTDRRLRPFVRDPPTAWLFPTKINQNQPDTGNSCKHPGYDDFDPPSWPGSCAPAKENWIQTSLGLCGEEGRYPEEFWNCADIE